MSVLTQVQTVTQHLVMRPDQDLRTPLITWPFLPKAQQTPSKQPELTSPKRPQTQKPPVLLRTTSFVKLRQFCNQSCDALKFLRARRTALQTAVSHGLLQAKACLLVAAVYMAVCLLAIQLFACFYLLAGKRVPPGLVFMVLSLFAVVGTFSKILIEFTRRKSRTARRAIHTSRKDQ